LNFAKSVLDTVRNRSFEKNLAARVKLPYTDWWYQQNNNVFLKEENLPRNKEENLSKKSEVVN